MKRIFHTWDKWECHKHGFYESRKEGVSKAEGEQAYADFLSNDDKFRLALRHIIDNWKYSCEHYLTNASMNRIAWLGQASACYSEGLPMSYCHGFNLMTDEQKEKANNTALEFLNEWLVKHDMDKVDVEAGTTNRQSTIY